MGYWDIPTTRAGAITELIRMAKERHQMHRCAPMSLIAAYHMRERNKFIAIAKIIRGGTK